MLRHSGGGANIAVFRIDPASGELQFRWLVNTPTPVDVEFGSVAGVPIAKQSGSQQIRRWRDGFEPSVPG
jgi:hypothetical protein